MLPIAFGGSGGRAEFESEYIDQGGPVFGPQVPVQDLQVPTVTPTEVPTPKPSMSPTRVPAWTPQSGGNWPDFAPTFPPDNQEPPLINIEAGPDLKFAQE